MGDSKSLFSQSPHLWPPKPKETINSTFNRMLNDGMEYDKAWITTARMHNVSPLTVMCAVASQEPLGVFGI